MRYWPGLAAVNVGAATWLIVKWPNHQPNEFNFTRALFIKGWKQFGNPQKHFYIVKDNRETIKTHDDGMTEIK